MVEWAILLIFPAIMAYAAMSDLLTMTIPNVLPLLLVMAFAILAPAIGMPLAVAAAHGLAALVVLAVTFVFFTRGWMGGGDAKLAAATALWIGWDGLLDYVLLSSVFGGLLTLGLLSLRGLTVHPPVLIREPWYARLTHPASGIPYGIALAAAGLVLYQKSGWMQMAG